MNLNGIGSSLAGIRTPLADPRTRGIQQERVPTAPAPAAAPRQAAAAAAAKQAAQTVPAEPPPGTDPELWAVLSADERAFFSRVGAMGPLTYGYVMQTGQMPNEAPASRGVRLDVRV